MGNDANGELGGVLEFMRILWGLNHELDAFSKRMRARFGVTGPQRMMIRIIGRRPGISLRDLAALLRVHPSTASPRLARIVELGLVDRVVDPNDARRVRLSLTRKGKRIDAVRRGTVEGVVERTLRGLPKGEVADAGATLRALSTALSAAGGRMG